MPSANHQDGGEDWFTCDEASTYLLRWAREPLQAATAHCREKRLKFPRPYVKAYRDSVSAFCGKWNLSSAWWAVPAMVIEHFERFHYPDATPLMVPMWGWRQQGPLTQVAIRLPGRSVEEFEHDKERFLNYQLEQVQQFSSGPIKIVRRPNREQLATIEKEHNAACVVVDWDGRDEYVVRGIQTSAAGYLFNECIQRMGHKATNRELQNLRRQIDTEMARAKQELVSQGWTKRSRADLQQHARWTASRLLNTGQTWEQISGLGYVDPRVVQRACAGFAKRAGLKWPIPRQPVAR